MKELASLSKKTFLVYFIVIKLLLLSFLLVDNELMVQIWYCSSNLQVAWFVDTDKRGDDDDDDDEYDDDNDDKDCWLA